MKEKAQAKVRPDWFKEGDGFVDIALSRPLTVAGAKVSTVRMREPLVDDQLAATAAGGDDDAKTELALMANLATLAPSDLGKMPLRDYRRLQYTFVSFTD